MGENGKRLSGASSRVGGASMYEGRTLLNTLGGRFKGGSPTRTVAAPQAKAEDLPSSSNPPCSSSSKEERLAAAPPTSSNENHHNNANESVSGHKRKCPDSSDTGPLQWGQRRKQRNGRVEAGKVASNHSTNPNPEEISKKAIRADRRLVRAEKQLGLGSNPSRRSPMRQHEGTSKRNGEVLNGNGGSTSHSEEAQEHKNQHNHHRHASPAGESGAAEDESHKDQDGQQQQSMDMDQKHAPEKEKVNMELFEWPKFLISLSRKEKEDDFLAIKGSKLPQRPKRRSKHVEKILHYCSPGMWLSDLGRDRYEVREKKSIKKAVLSLREIHVVEYGCLSLTRGHSKNSVLIEAQGIESNGKHGE